LEGGHLVVWNLVLALRMLVVAVPLYKCCRI
jgi:hypothetical protein